MNARATQAAGSVVKPFTGAVMRVPVLVPPDIASVSDIRRRNVAAMVQAIEDAARAVAPPRIIVFPVLQAISSQRALSGVPIADVAVDLTDGRLESSIFAPLLAACRRHGCYAVTTTQEKTARLPGRYFHTGFILGPEGLVLRSPKIQARTTQDVTSLRDIEDKYVSIFGPNSILPVTRTPLGVIGCFVEEEAEVFEASRMLSSRGADIIVHPSIEQSDGTPWLPLKQSIAYLCQVYLLTGATSRNIRASASAGGWCGGSATIVDPFGQVVASLTGHNEGCATAVIDTALVQEARARNSVKATPAWTIYRKLYNRPPP